MKKLRSLLFIFLSSFLIYSFASNVTVSVDKTSVSLNDNVQLTIKIEAQDSSLPDISTFLNNFSVLNTLNGENIEIVNGKQRDMRYWQFVLAPKNTGSFTLPALKIGGDSSQPVTINVTPATASPSPTATPQTTSTNATPNQATNQAKQLFLEASIEPKDAYVQSQLIYTVKIYINDRIENAIQKKIPVAPTADNAIIEPNPLGTAQYSSEIRGGVSYQVIKIKYAIFPQKSGPLIINPAQLYVQVLETVNEFDFGTLNNYVVSGDKMIINVKEKPANYTADNWLPAQSLDVKENWSTDLSAIHVGEPITRTITLSAEGLKAAQLPAINPGTAENVNIYPDQPNKKDVMHENSITGTETVKIAYIPTHAGKYVLPEINIPWFNTSKNQIEIAKLKAKKITVTGSAPVTTATVDQQDVQTTSPASAPIANSKPATHKSMKDYLPWFIAAIFAFGWLMTILMIWFYKRRKSKTNINQPLTIAGTINAVKVACFSNDPNAIKNALLSFAKLRWPNECFNLGQLSQFIPEEKLATKINLLNNILYSHEKTVFNGKELWNLFSTSAIHHTGSHKKIIENVIPTLHPEDM